MTTLAYKSGILAADTKVSDDSDYVANATKIRKMQGHLIGASGDMDVMHWFLTNFKPDLLTGKLQLKSAGILKEGSLDAIIVDPEGKLYHYSDRLLVTPITAFNYYACGSGSPFALGAMFAGATAKEAVKAAMKHDAHTGGRLMSIKLDRKPRKA